MGASCAIRLLGIFESGRRNVNRQEEKTNQKFGTVELLSNSTSNNILCRDDVQSPPEQHRGPGASYSSNVVE
jgi:hypothetical protein